VSKYDHVRLTEQQLRDRIYNEVLEHFQITMSPTKMHWLSCQYNKDCLRLGYAKFRDFVYSDDRLIVKLNKRGGRLVAPKAGVLELFPSYENRRKYWLGHGIAEDYTD
jgi:hypothetical protein